jgi:nucleoside 2-deoxyribosyltransferase
MSDSWRLRVYLAARYSRREELVGYQRELEHIGAVVPSRWLLGEHQWEGKAAEVAEAYEKRLETPPEAVQFALDDWEDLRSADVVVSFTEAPRASSTSRGGRHVEFGMAYALGKPCIVVGYRENVFHLLPGVEYAPDWSGARGMLALLIADKAAA